MHYRFLSLVAAALLACAPSYAGAQTAAQPLQGKQIRFFTMGGPGGGYDTYMRVLIPALEKSLGARLIPINEPAGGGLTVMHRTISAIPDGQTISLLGGEIFVTGQLYKVPGFNYDLQKLEWIARVSAEDKVAIIAANSPYKSLSDMVRSEKVIIWAGSGKADSNTDFGAVLAHATGMKARMILGYKGSGGMNLAIQNGEIDARVVSDEAAALFMSGTPMRVVTVMSRQRSKKFPDVPTVFEEMKLDEAQAKMVDWRAGVAKLGRLIITTPGTPPATVAALREAFRFALQDEATRATIKKHQLEPDFASGETVKDMIAAAMTTLDEKSGEEIRRVVLDKYY